MLFDLHSAYWMFEMNIPRNYRASGLTAMVKNGYQHSLHWTLSTLGEFDRL